MATDAAKAAIIVHNAYKKGGAEKCECLRCGYVWYDRPGFFSQIDHCVRCGHKWWLTSALDPA